MAVLKRWVIDQHGITHEYQCVVKQISPDLVMIQLFNATQNYRIEFTCSYISWNAAINNLFVTINGKPCKTTITPHENKTIIQLNHQNLQQKIFEIAKIPLSQTKQHIRNPTTSHIFKNTLHAPLAGRVVKTFVQLNQLVQKNDRLLILESMKMENEIRAEHQGYVTEIMITEGDVVQSKAPLIRFREV